MEGGYNMRSPAVKRLMREAEELKHPTEEYYAQPLEDNLFEWHFTVRGPSKTDFDGGLYHGRITLPPDYPMKPPSIILMTPNGRFEVNKKICLSISGHHPESWQPSWSIRTALLAMIGFMPTHGNGAIGSLDYSPEERRQLALNSQKWKCTECGPLATLLQKPVSLSSEKERVQIKAVEENGCFTSTFGEEFNESSKGVANTICMDVHESAVDNSAQYLSSESAIVQSIPLQRHASSLRNNDSLSSEIIETSTHVEAHAHPMQYGAFATVFMWIIVFLIFALLIRRLIFL